MVADDILENMFYYFSEKIRFGISCESSATCNQMQCYKEGAKKVYFWKNLHCFSIKTPRLCELLLMCTHNICVILGI